jgi:succinate dehydrogenase/fumarate reductase-like Fe-S protein
MRWDALIGLPPFGALIVEEANANACKECMMLIDGRVDYACTVRLKEGVTALAPLPKKPLIRDLVTEIAPPDERLWPRP